jgi:outer membrane protein TolC
MANKIWIILLIVVINGVYLSGQFTYSLNSVLADVKSNAPIAGNGDLVNAERNLKVKNLNTKYLPQLNINGQSTYQSETTGLDLNFAGVHIPRLTKDQYKIQLDVNQLLYDGGSILSQKNLTGIVADIELRSTENELDQLAEQAMVTYFGILEVDKRLEILQLKKDDLTAISKKVGNAVQNGAALETELQKLEAEMAGIHQIEAELISMKTNLIQILQILTGKDLNLETDFIEPQSVLLADTEYESKPIFQILELQKKQLDVVRKLDMAQYKPKLLLFGQAGYGKPGLNFLKNEFTDYYIGGIRLLWNLNNLYTKSKDNQINLVQKQKIDIKYATLKRQTEIKLSAMRAEMSKYSTMLNHDDEIIALRQKIKNVANVQLEQGITTANDYILILNDESEARLNKNLHKLLWLKAAYLFNHYSTVSNN